MQPTPVQFVRLPLDLFQLVHAPTQLTFPEQHQCFAKAVLQCERKNATVLSEAQTGISHRLGGRVLTCAREEQTDEGLDKALVERVHRSVPRSFRVLMARAKSPVKYEIPAEDQYANASARALPDVPAKSI